VRITDQLFAAWATEITADVTSCRELPGQSAVLRYLLQYATLTGRDALGCSTISIPLNDWLVGQLISLKGNSQQQETAPLADTSIRSCLSSFFTWNTYDMIVLDGMFHRCSAVLHLLGIHIIL
jgi:hypothetical protein